MNRYRKHWLPLAMLIVNAATSRASESARVWNLEHTLGFALEHNYSIRQGRARIRQQEGVVTTVEAAGMPKVSATASFQRSSTQTVASQASGPVVFLPSGKFWRMSISASQTLYAGGGIRAGMDQAGLVRDAAVDELQAITAQALLEVRLRYYAVLLAKAQIEVEQSNLEVLERQLRDAINRFETGSTSRFERLRAEVAVANAKPPLIKARNDLRLAREELFLAMGMERSQDKPEEEWDIGGSFEIEPLSVDLVAALAAARTQRPELQRLSKLVAAANTGIAVALADYRPRVGASVGAELRKGASDSFGDSLKGWRGGLDSQWNIAPRQTAGLVRQTESIAAQANLSLDEMELTVQVEVRRAFASTEQASELVIATSKSVQQAEESARIADVRHRAGSSTQLELLQAQAALTTARTNQLRAMHSQSTAIARLRQAMGIPDVEYSSSSIASDQPVAAEQKP